MNYKKIALIGMRGTGKTTVGELLAERLNYEFYDLDEEIEKTSRESIPDIFKNKSENYFREIEFHELEKFVNINSNFVISLGGGIVENQHSIEILKNNFFNIHLYANKEVIYNRILDSDRPNLTNLNLKDEISFILNKRIDLYKSIENISLDTSNLTPIDCVINIMSIIRK